MLFNLNQRFGINRLTKQHQIGLTLSFRGMNSVMRLNCSSLDTQMIVISIAFSANYLKQARGIRSLPSKILLHDTNTQALRSILALINYLWIGRHTAYLIGLVTWGGLLMLFISLEWSWCIHFQLMHSKPYYSQAYSVSEVVNKALKGALIREGSLNS